MNTFRYMHFPANSCKHKQSNLPGQRYIAQVSNTCTLHFPALDMIYMHILTNKYNTYNTCINLQIHTN